MEVWSVAQWFSAPECESGYVGSTPTGPPSFFLEGMTLKITVSQEFDTPEAAAAFLALVGAAAASKPLRATSEAAVPPAAAAPSVAEKPARKPRSDAGQPRGPYNKDAAPAAPVAPAHEVKSAEPAPSAAATPTPTPVTAAPSAAAPQAPATSTAPSGAAPTHADATAALREMNKVKGLGMDACVGLLKDYGALSVSKLQPEQLPEFVATIKARIAGMAKPA